MGSKTSVEQSEADNQHVQEEKRLTEFVLEQPNIEYILDAPLLCRKTQSTTEGSIASPNHQSCIRSKLDAKEMFAQMQALGYFCQLPPEPGSTHMICRKL
ncbi:hypothetical protein BDF19DRAFT_441734 [Syncephalis fuscata]|nr:hypothetical protein BDF19DRAFT_441734 [Syncephalis fuscata]